jgi:hypothetical protein
MKSDLLCVLIFASSFIGSAYASQTDDDWGPTTNDLQMSISLNCSEIKTDQPCVLSIRYRNVSTNEMFRIYEVNGTVYDPTYSFTVTSPSGEDISPDTADIHESGSGQDHHLYPGQILNISFDLSLVCKFDKAGTYQVIAKRNEIWSIQKHRPFTVVSNPLRITVTN